MQRILLACCLLCLLSCSLLKAQNQKAIILDENNLGIKDIRQSLSFYIDNSQELTIEDFLVQDPVGFTNGENFQKQATSPSTIWFKLKVINQVKEDRNLIFLSSDCASAISLYEVVAGDIKKVHYNGHTLSPLKKEIPSAYPKIPVSALADETTDYYIMAHFPREVSWIDCYSFRLEESKADIPKIINTSTGQTFYAGLMLMFSLLSFFTFILFRDKDFIYFGFVHIAFAFYFLVNKGAFLMLVYNIPFILGFRIRFIAISLLILSLSVFLARYLKLRQKNKKYYVLFSIVSLIAIINYYPIYFFLKSVYIAANVSNAFYIIWIIIALIPIISQAKEGDKSAINLLIAISLLVFASIIYLLTTLGVLSKNLITSNSFQISTILFSLLVFYRLFEIVSEISAEKFQAISLNDLKSKFFTNISHEFRTPLTLIIGPLKQLIDNSSNEKDVKLMEGALKNSNRLLNMVNQLLDLSKIESNHLKLNIEKSEFTSFVKGVFMSFESLADTKHLKMEFESKTQSLDLWYDVEKMEIIFFNLLSNAFKFTPENGLISMKVLDNHESIEVIISDSGKGIMAENLPFVFDRFFRVENSQDNAVEGSGIGLSLTRELVELHHGKILVESEIGEGTTFKLTFKKGKDHYTEENFSSENSNQISSTFDIDLLKENSNELDIVSNITSAPKLKKSTILLLNLGLDSDKKEVKSLDTSDLHRMFSDAGELKRILLFSKKTLLKAFLEYSNADESQKALSLYHEKFIGKYGKARLYCSPLQEIDLSNKYLEYWDKETGKNEGEDFNSQPPFISVNNNKLTELAKKRNRLETLVQLFHSTRDTPNGEKNKRRKSSEKTELKFNTKCSGILKSKFPCDSEFGSSEEGEVDIRNSRISSTQTLVKNFNRKSSGIYYLKGQKFLKTKTEKNKYFNYNNFKKTNNRKTTKRNINILNLISPSKVVLVSNLGFVFGSSEELFNLLSCFGIVNGLILMKNLQRALVEFSNVESATECITNIDNLSLGPTRLRVNYSKHKKIDFEQQRFGMMDHFNEVVKYPDHFQRYKRGMGIKVNPISPSLILTADWTSGIKPLDIFSYIEYFSKPVEVKLIKEKRNKVFEERRKIRLHLIFQNISSAIYIIYKCHNKTVKDSRLDIRFY